MTRPSKYPPIWSEEINDLQVFFQTVELPSTLKMSEYETITRPADFVKTNLSIVSTNNGNPYFLNYLERLRKVKQLLQTI